MRCAHAVAHFLGPDLCGPRDAASSFDLFFLVDALFHFAVPRRRAHLFSLPLSLAAFSPDATPWVL